VFGVGFGGRLSARPVVNSEAGTVPFAISFDQAKIGSVTVPGAAGGEGIVAS
jgi:hypothetical protein